MVSNRMREECYEATMERTKELRVASYKVFEVWACQTAKIQTELQRLETKSYPHAILHDFEAYGDKNQCKDQTVQLTIESTHFLISVSVWYTLEREPGKDRAVLLQKFMEELERCRKNIQAAVRAEFMSEDMKMLPQKHWPKITQWCSSSTPDATI